MALRVDDVDLARDHALVARFQEGDPNAFDALYTRYFGRLTRFCLRRVGDPADAEEIAQEAFARAFRALPSFDGPRRFYPWVTVIAERLCIDEHRRRSRTEPAADIEPGEVPGGDEQVVKAYELNLLGQAVERLAPRHREVLELRERDGLSYDQIAAHYDVPITTVEALLFRARKALKREFMALAGGGRSFVTLPVLGGMGRLFASWRARVGGWAAALPSAAGSAVATAGVVTGLTIASVGGSLAVGTPHADARVAAPQHPVAAAAAAAAPGGDLLAPALAGQPGWASLAGGPTASRDGALVDPGGAAASLRVSPGLSRLPGRLGALAGDDPGSFGSWTPGERRDADGSVLADRLAGILSAGVTTASDLGDALAALPGALAGAGEATAARLPPPPDGAGGLPRPARPSPPAP